MKEEELIRKLETVDLSGIGVESHRVQLRKALLESKYFREKPEPSFLRRVKSKMKVPLISNRPVWQKALATFVIVAVILGIGSIFLIIQDPSEQALAWEVVADKAHAATLEVTSFHFDASNTQTGWYEGIKVYEDPDWLWIVEGDFLAPDRMQWTEWKKNDGQKLEEVRIIGNNLYEWNSQTGEWELQYLDQSVHNGVVQGFSEFIQPVSIAERLKTLDDIEELPDEVIDNVDCLHYRGRWDIDILENMGETVPAPVIEFWISKDNYLVHQQRITISQDVNTDDLNDDYKDMSLPKDAIITISATKTITYSDFNEPVEIEAPL